MSGYPPNYYATRGPAPQPPPPMRGPRLALDLVTLPPIFPAPVRDFRTLDFTALINNPAMMIDRVTWECHAMPDTPVDDFEPELRLLADPTIDPPTGQLTSVLVGDMIDGVTYLLIAQATIGDGRLLIRRGSLKCIAQPLEAPLLRPGEIPFNYTRFLTLFPEFTSISEEQAHGYWSMACEILRNDNSSPVRDPAEREEILLLLTAHLAALFGGPMGGGGFGPQITGGINSKSVNGVSISGGGILPGVTGTQAWYQLTRYGQMAWMKLRAYRLFHYIPGPERWLYSPFTAWPWTVAGIRWPGGGWPWPTWQPGAPRPPEPPVEPEAVIYVDGTSVVGDGRTPATALSIRVVEGGEYSDMTGAAARRPWAVKLPRGQLTIYIDSAVFAGDGLTTGTALAVRAVAGASYNGQLEPGPMTPIAVQYTVPVTILTDGVSVVGDGRTPQTALSVRVVAGRANGNGNGSSSGYRY